MVVHAQPGRAAAHHTVVPPRIRARTAHAHFPKRPDPARQLADKILAFALGAAGRQVGDGECFSLADQALTQAGAKSAAYYTDITPDGDYVWGRRVPPESAKPGDILQFRNFRIVRRITVTGHGPDGDETLTQNQEVEERDHHTAIVTQNLGNALAVVEQNVEPLGRVVQRNDIEITTGTTTKINPADSTQTTTEVSVDGDVRAYRPQQSLPTTWTATHPGM